MKILWLDVETTGLNPQVNDIITLAGYIEIDGKIEEEFNYKLKPINPETIEPEALRVNGLSKEEVMAYPDAIEAKKDLSARLKHYVDPYKKNKTMDDKFICAGQNISFDVDFLRALWNKCGDKYIGALIDYHKIDLVSLTQILKIKKIIDVPNLKLETIASYYKVPLIAHDAKNDIKATREIYYKILNKLEFKK